MAILCCNAFSYSFLSIVGAYDQARASCCYGLSQARSDSLQFLLSRYVQQAEGRGPFPQLYNDHPHRNSVGLAGHSQISNKWNALSPEEKKVYIDLSEKDKQRYIYQRNEVFSRHQIPGIPLIAKTRGSSSRANSRLDKQSFLYKSATQRNVPNFCDGLLLSSVFSSPSPHAKGRDSAKALDLMEAVRAQLILTQQEQHSGSLPHTLPSMQQSMQPSMQQSMQQPLSDLYGDSSLPMYGGALTMGQQPAGTYLTPPLAYSEMRNLPLPMAGVSSAYGGLQHQENYAVLPTPSAQPSQPPVPNIQNVQSVQTVQTVQNASSVPNGQTPQPLPSMQTVQTLPEVHGLTYPLQMLPGAVLPRKPEPPVEEGVLPYACPLSGCGKRFASKLALRRHQVEHTENGKLYQCEQPGCNACFITASGLYKHRQTHAASQRQFRCDFSGCNKVFRTKHGLHLHQQNIHTRNKPYVCKE